MKAIVAFLRRHSGKVALTLDALGLGMVVAGAVVIAVVVRPMRSLTGTAYTAPEFPDEFVLSYLDEDGNRRLELIHDNTPPIPKSGSTVVLWYDPNDPNMVYSRNRWRPVKAGMIFLLTAGSVCLVCGLLLTVLHLRWRRQATGPVEPGATPPPVDPRDTSLTPVEASSAEGDGVPMIATGSTPKAVTP